MTNIIKISVIGLGYVGLPLAVEFGKKFQTIGFDINEKRIAELKNGLDCTDELTNENLKLSLKTKHGMSLFFNISKSL